MPQDPRSPDGGPTKLSDAVAHLLGNRRRIEMLQHLSERSMTAIELGELHGMKGTNTLHYLHQLREHGWVEVAAVTQRHPGGVFEYRWRATPGVDWTQVAAYLNELETQLRPTPDPDA